MRRSKADPILADMPIRTHSPSLVVLLTLVLTGCSPGVDWSTRERENATHLLASLKFTSDAAAVANQVGNPDELEAHRDELLRLLRAAHWNAANVDDQVLDKLHPQMFGRFRMSYQPALGAMIRAYERNDIDAAQKAANAIRNFMNWYRVNRHTFRWWDEALQG